MIPPGLRIRGAAPSELHAITEAYPTPQMSARLCRLLDGPYLRLVSSCGMNLRYCIRSTAGGWSILENGEIVRVEEDVVEALEIGRLLTSAAKAAGSSATLMVEGDGSAGEAGGGSR